MNRNLNTVEIAGRLMEAGCHLFYKEEIDSTNEWAKREAKAGAPSGCVYLSDRQTAGKGSRGRSWDSPEDTSIYMSLLLRLDIAPQKLSMLTLLMGMAAAEGIHVESGLKTSIKWPNDVVYEGKKLCGILTELSPQADSVVIGIGINVNNAAFPEEIKETATSISQGLGYTVAREGIAASVILAFFRYLRFFEKTQDLSLLKGEYQRLLANLNQKVKVLDPSEPYEGLALGIDELGQLLVKRDDSGEVVKVFAGEVSVRGIYGYV